MDTYYNDFTMISWIEHRPRLNNAKILILQEKTKKIQVSVDNLILSLSFCTPIVNFMQRSQQYYITGFSNPLVFTPSVGSVTI